MLQNSENCKIYKSSQELVDYFVSHFGLSQDIFDHKEFYQMENSSIVYMSEKSIPKLRNITQPGMPIFKGEFPKGYPTNAFVYRYGNLATSNAIEVNEEDIEPLLKREGVKYNPNVPTFGGTNPSNKI